MLNGIHLAADWADKKSVLVASEIADAFQVQMLLQIQKCPEQSLFIPLENLIKENMPNLTKAMEKEPKIKAMITSPDGHLQPAKKSPFVLQQLISYLLIKSSKDNLGLKV